MRGRRVCGGLLALAVVGLAGAPDLEAAPDKPDAARSGEAPALTREAIEAATLPSETGGEDRKTEGSKPETGKSEMGKSETGKTEAAKGAKAKDKAPDPLLAKAQILLDRAHFSPGAIDGRDGDNLRSALSAFAVAQGLKPTKTLDAEVFAKLQASGSEPVTMEYTLTEADIAGPYLEKIPPKMEDQGELDALGYTGAREMLAERFHMTPGLLDALNPGKPLDKAGTVIAVAAVAPMGTEKPKKEEMRTKDVSRVEVDKESRDLRAFDKAGKLVAYYPASIGSEEKPAPSGRAKVEGVAFAPTYTYDPKYKFDGVKAKTKFTIPPGPNNPVGLVWIDLSIPSYGIHGTPEPEKVGKTESHGCIRLTNWDARDLAARIERGAEVVFKDE